MTDLLDNDSNLLTEIAQHVFRDENQDVINKIKGANWDVS